MCEQIRECVTKRLHEEQAPSILDRGKAVRQGELRTGATSTLSLVTSLAWRRSTPREFFALELSSFFYVRSYDMQPSRPPSRRDQLKADILRARHNNKAGRGAHVVQVGGRWAPPRCGGRPAGDVIRVLRARAPASRGAHTRFGESARQLRPWLPRNHRDLKR